MAEKLRIISISLVLFWYLLAISNIVLYIFGFFPVKSKSSHIVVMPPTLINNARVDAGEMYRPEVSSVILVVIDGLRRDFVNKNKMPYLYSHTQRDKGCLLSIRAETPTVTMPRIKAITTGSVPQFIDIVLNFASYELKGDSLLHQARGAGRKMVFYGDNTWLKLFPNMFTRSDGTTSFYVTDFTEVDNNVTRHLNQELSGKDWDILILHYLGLDHIGHIHGPYHPLIKKKLLEMDAVIKQIYSAVKDDNTVVLVCGDHGMRDQGGHGGSSDSETIVPLAVLGLQCLSQDFSLSAQNDIAPTLSALMGLPLPADNVGRILSELINSYPLARQLYFLHYNSLNLIEKDLLVIHEQFQDLFKKHAEFIQFGNHSGRQLLLEYEQKIMEVSEELIKKSTGQHLSYLFLACSALTIVILAILLPEIKLLFLWFSLYLITSVLTTCTLCFPDSKVLAQIVELYSIVPVCTLLSVGTNVYETFRSISKTWMGVFLWCGTFIRTVSLASTSSIEEEHHTWYFLWGSLTLLGAYNQYKSNQSWNKTTGWIVLFVGLRILRDWNHVGLYASKPDISDWLLEEDQWIWLMTIFIIGLIGTAYCSTLLFPKDKLTNSLSFFILLVIFWYRIDIEQHQTIYQARIAKLFMLKIAVISYLKHRNVFKSSTLLWMLWTTLLMRPHNVILIPACVIASGMVQKLTKSVVCLAFIHIWLAEIFFHCQGLYNNLASVDISPGYVGLTDYSPVLTAFQVVCNVYTFYILSLLCLLQNLPYNAQEKTLHIFVLYRLSSMLYFCIISLIHRQHLFVWSVFSPKLLIEASHCVCLLFYLVIYQVKRGVCSTK